MSRSARQRDQQGVSIVLVLIVMVLVGVSVMALLSFATTANKSASAHISNQEARVAGDNGIRAAINWVARTPNVGRDAAMFGGTDPDCLYNMPASVGGVNVAVDCQAIAGTNSGVPNETGKVPPNAILLLGTRYGELPNYSPCTGSETNRRNKDGREVGLLLDEIALRRVDTSTVNCRTMAGAIDRSKGFWVRGDIRSNGPVVVKDGKLRVESGSIVAGTSPLIATGTVPCIGTIKTPPPAGSATEGSVSCVATPTDRPRGTPNGPANSPYNPGEALFTDPGADGSSTKAEWRQGLVNWSVPKVSVNGGAPIELTGANMASILAQCTRNPNLVRFYPGLYRSAEALNQIFNQGACANGADNGHPGVFWFGPAENAANGQPTGFSLGLLADGGTPQQGVYSFDFRDSAGGIACGAMANTNNPHRWCAKQDVTNDLSPSIIGGWPSNWDPATFITPPLPGNPAVTMRTLGYFQRVDDDNSVSWSNLDRVKQYGDSNFAVYRPTSISSINRSMILSGMREAIGGAGLLAVKPDGRMSFTVRHLEANASLLNKPVLTISTSERGVGLACGRFEIDKSSDPDTQGSGTGDAALAARPWAVHSVGTEPTDTVQLSGSALTRMRNCFRNSERIGNLQFKWEVGGDGWNSGRCPVMLETSANLACPGPNHWARPVVAVDGIQVSVEVETESLFGELAAMPADYCDDSKPGVQFVFGGDSHLHLGNASMQLCAGPPPADVKDVQQVAVWGQPVNSAVVRTGATQATYNVGTNGTATLKGTAVSTSTSTCSWWMLLCQTNPPEWIDAIRATEPGDRFVHPTEQSRSLAKFDSGYALLTSNWGKLTVSGFSKVAAFGSSDCTGSAARSNLCIDPASQSISAVDLKIGYNSDCSPIEGITFCTSGAGRVKFKLFDGATELCASSDSGDPRSFLGTDQRAWFATNVMGCFGNNPATAYAKLSSGNVKVEVEMVCNNCLDNNKEVEGVELIVKFSTNPNADIISPATGCRSSAMGYGSGVGDVLPVDVTTYDHPTNGTDCALISGAPPAVLSLPDEADSVRRTGRVSVMGTVYAPSDALEVSDGDVFYPLASRGLVARHLRVRAVENRPGYDMPMVTNDIDDRPRDRNVVLTACRRANPAAAPAPCDEAVGDILLSQAEVTFAAPTSGNAADRWTPHVVWWDNNIL